MFFKYPISDDMKEWIYDSFYWAIENKLLTEQTTLITPTRANFSTPSGEPRIVAQGLVEDIQRHLSMSDVRIVVEPLNVIGAEYRIDYNAMVEVAGNWHNQDGLGIIGFDPAGMERRIAFLSTLAHEVMHHRLHMTALDMPGGAEAEELSTDLHCFTTGFGAIQMAGADEAGWAGYMRQETRAYALALFLAVLGIPENEASGFLVPRSVKKLRRAAKLVASEPEEVSKLQAALIQ